MASRTVRKIKRGKNKESTSKGNTLEEELPAIIVTPPVAANKVKEGGNIKNSHDYTQQKGAQIVHSEYPPNNTVTNINKSLRNDKDTVPSTVLEIAHLEMKFKSIKDKPITDSNVGRTDPLSQETVTAQTDGYLIRTQSGPLDDNSRNIMESQDHYTRNQIDPVQRFDVSQLIAELSQNSKSSSSEIKNIQKKLLHQANEILRENSSTNVFQIQGTADQICSNQNTLPDKRNTPSHSQPLNIHEDTQMIPEKLQMDIKTANAHPRSHVPNHLRLFETDRSFPLSHSLRPGGGTAMSCGDTGAAGHMQRVDSAAVASFVFSKSGTGSCADATQSAGRPGSVRVASEHTGVTYDGAHGVSVYAPVPPAYRMPPAPAHAAHAAHAAGDLPGASNTLHTHSNKFPIEREVILSTCDKDSKIPILHELKKRAGRLGGGGGGGGGAVAPDAPPPPKTLAWSHTNVENQQQPSTSTDLSYRQQYHEQSYYSHNTSAPLQRNPHDNSSQKPPVPSKNMSLYASRDQNGDITPNNSQSITVTVETGKDSTKDAPKSTKSVTKTYHTLKDMISSRFKGKDTTDTEKSIEIEAGLNNVSEENRKSTRDSKNLEEPRAATPREAQTRKMEPNIYGRPMLQNRGDPYHQQLVHGSASNLGYTSPSPHQQMLTVQHQMMQQQMIMSQQHALGHGPGASSTPQHKLQQNAMMARSQEVLSSPPQHSGMGRPASQMMEGRHSQLVADGLYQQQYGVAGRRSGIYQRDPEVANFTSLKQTGPQGQYENPRSRTDMRSPQQLEREIVRQRVHPDSRLSASQSQLDQSQARSEHYTALMHDRAIRSSQGNLLEATEHPRMHSDETSDDGGFRAHHVAQARSSFENRINNGGRPPENGARAQNGGHRQETDRDHRHAENVEKNDENLSQKSVDSVYNASSKVDSSHVEPPQPAARQTPSRIEDLKGHGKKALPGSAASSDYDKNGGQSSNVDSGRGSVAYSSGRRLHDTSADSDALGAAAAPRASDQAPVAAPPASAHGGDPEWVDIVESELRQILEPKMHALRLEGSGGGSSSASSVTPPLPPLSPGASDSTSRHRRKHQSLPLGSRPEYSEECRRRGRESPPRAWQHHHKPKHSSKREQHASHYKKHLFGLDTTDMTSTTTRSLDLSSMLDGRSDSDVSAQDARAIRRQLHGLENMYCEVLKLLGVRKPAAAHPLGKYQPSDPRMSKRRYGSMSSLPSSSVSSRPARDKRRSLNDHRKKSDLKNINKRFQRLESHVVTLARSVAHLSSEMRTQHLVMQEMDGIRAEIAALRHMYKSQAQLRGQGLLATSDPQAFSNPERVKRLTKFFGDEPPLMRLFLKRLGYEKYASLLEAERVGAAELPYVGEERLRALGVPLGPRMRILKEAGAHRDLHQHATRDAQGNTTTTLAIV